MDGQAENWGAGEPQTQAFIDAVFAEVTERGGRPLSAGQIRSAAGAGADPKTVAEALAGELHPMARWLRLEGITVAAKGNLAKPLLEALR